MATQDSGDKIVSEVSEMIDAKLSVLRARTKLNLRKRRALIDAEIQFFKTDANFSKYFQFVSAINSDKSKKSLKKRANDMYETYSSYMYFRKQQIAGRVTDLWLDYDLAQGTVSIKVDWEVLEKQHNLVTLEDKISHRTDYLFKKWKLVLESKNYGNDKNWEVKDGDDISFPLSKFVRDVYCYCRLCEIDFASRVPFAGIILARKLPIRLKSIQSPIIFLDRTIELVEIP